MRPISKSKTVHIRIQAGQNTAGREVPFPEIPELRGKIIYGVEAFVDTQLARTPDGTSVLPTAEQANVTLTLKESATARHEDLPISTLIAANVDGIWKEFTPFAVDWQKSFVRIVATITADRAIPFTFYYE